MLDRARDRKSASPYLAAAVAWSGKRQLSTAPLSGITQTEILCQLQMAVLGNSGYGREKDRSPL
jgi:hypothetical protein